MKNNNQQIFWIIWASILMGLFVIIEFVGGGFPSGESDQNLSMGLSIITISGACVSTFIRWAVLPKIKNSQTMLSTMIIGLALAESTAILALFFLSSEFPSEQRIAIIFSLITIIQYIPFYAPKSEQDAAPNP